MAPKKPAIAGFFIGLNVGFWPEADLRDIELRRSIRPI